MAPVNRILYPNIYACVCMMLTMIVLTATLERLLSIIRRRIPMISNGLSFLALIHAYKNHDIGVEMVVYIFAAKKDSQMAF